MVDTQQSSYHLRQSALFRKILQNLRFVAAHVFDPGTFLYKLRVGAVSRGALTGLVGQAKEVDYFEGFVPGIHSVGMSSPPWKWENCLHCCRTALSSKVSRYCSHQVPGGVYRLPDCCSRCS